MTLSEFKATLKDKRPPATVTHLLLALWHDGQGDWNSAHQVAQEIDTAEGAWVHAYLHRKEGDLSNAAYWYQQAHRKMPTGSWEQEWEMISASLLNEQSH